MMDERREHEAFEALLSSDSGFDEGELGRLAALARALEANRPAQAGPRPEFRAALRSRLVETAEAASVVVPLSLAARIRAELAVRDARMRRSFRTVFAVAAAAMMLLVGGAALAAAPDSKPGDGLYWLDRAKERAELFGSFGTSAKATKHLDLARERLEEVRALADAGATESALYTQALKDMDGSTLDATELIVGAFRRSDDRGLLARLLNFSLAQRQGLESLENVLPVAAQPRVRGSIELVIAVQNRVSDVLGGCPCPGDALVPAASAAPGAPGAPECDCEAKPSAPSDPGTKPRAQEPPADPKPGDDGPPPDEDHPHPPAPGVLPPVTGTGIEDQVNQIVNGLLGQLLPSPSPLPLP